MPKKDAQGSIGKELFARRELRQWRVTKRAKGRFWWDIMPLEKS